MARYRHNTAFKKYLLDTLERNSKITGAYIVARIQRRISRNQPRRKTKSGRWVGLNPSAPGTPPKVLSGDLRRSIRYETKRGRRSMKLTMIAGDNKKVVYAQRLEATENEGGINRPYIRSTIRKHSKQILRLLTKHKIKRAS